MFSLSCLKLCGHTHLFNFDSLALLANIKPQSSALLTRQRYSLTIATQSSAPSLLNRQRQRYQLISISAAHQHQRCSSASAPLISISAAHQHQRCSRNSVSTTHPAASVLVTHQHQCYLLVSASLINSTHSSAPLTYNHQISVTTNLRHRRSLSQLVSVTANLT